jgi:cytochrome c554/c'-like protein
MGRTRVSSALVTGIALFIGWAADGLPSALASAAGGAGGAAQGLKPPVATLRVVPVAANPKDPNAIAATLPGSSETVAVGVTGLTNVSIGVPVTLEAGVADPKGGPAERFAWTLTAPGASNAKLSDAAAAVVRFVPDVAGAYKVDATASNQAGRGPLASLTLHAGTYIGADKGGCKTCHGSQAAEWARTGHASIFTRNLDEDPTRHYTEKCMGCHTTGYYPGVADGGFADVQARTGWKFPPKVGVKGTFDGLPPDLKALGNIQCESCHGPAREHVVDKAKGMGVSLDEGVCNVCHNGGGFHIKGEELKNAKHTDAGSHTWTYASGPAQTPCVRCHSGAGYITFLKNPGEPAAWDYRRQQITCAVCHDPHSDTHPFQLRIVGKPVALPVEVGDLGLSATCAECHNGRAKPEDMLRAEFPHYSAIAEIITDQGGIDYGRTLANSPHGSLVGRAPVPDPADKTGKKMLFGGVTPGPCVTCHMWPTIMDAKDPNVLKVGGHSFNTVGPDRKFHYTAACQSCHAGLKAFNPPAKADYDGNGKVEGAQDEVAGLLKLLLKAITESGIKTQQNYPYFLAMDKASDRQRRAVYNFRFVNGVMWDGNGRAAAVHNLRRAVMLLQLSYKDLTGQDVPGAALLR